MHNISFRLPGVGVLFSLAITMLHPSEKDKTNGIDLRAVFTNWKKLAEGHSPAHERRKQDPEK